MRGDQPGGVEDGSGDETSLAPTFLMPGTIVRAKWTIGPVIDRGPVTTRYAATYRTGHPVLLDMLHESWSRDADLKASYLRASYLANRVDHPAVVRVLDDGVSEDGLAFVVTDRFEGETLGERARRLGGKIPRLDVYDIGDRLLDAVAAAHECGVIHGDLRPDRVILTVKGELRVTAFGSGQLVAQRFPSAVSMRFSPPEAQLAGGMLDARSDVWSIAACLYAVITGRFEPTGDGRVPMLPTYAPDAPPELVESIDRALARDRHHRWQTARQMQQSWRVAWAADGVREQTVFEVRKPDRPSNPASALPSSGGAPLQFPRHRPSTGPMAAISSGQPTPPAPATYTPPPASMYIPTPGAFPVPATAASAQISLPPPPQARSLPTAIGTGPYATVSIDDVGADSRTSLSLDQERPGGQVVPGYPLPAPAPSPSKSPSVTVDFPNSSAPSGDPFGPRSSEPNPSMKGAAPGTGAGLGIVPVRRGRTVAVVLLLAVVSLGMVGFVARFLLVLFLHRGGR